MARGRVKIHGRGKHMRKKGGRKGRRKHSRK